MNGLSWQTLDRYKCDELLVEQSDGQVQLTSELHDGKLQLVKFIACWFISVLLTFSLQFMLKTKRTEKFSCFSVPLNCTNDVGLSSCYSGLSCHHWPHYNNRFNAVLTLCIVHSCCSNWISHRRERLRWSLLATNKKQLRHMMSYCIVYLLHAQCWPSEEKAHGFNAADLEKM